MEKYSVIIEGYSAAKHVLLSFLNKKAQFKFINYRWDQKKSIITVKTQNEGNALLKINGEQMNGHTLSVKIFKKNSGSGSMGGYSGGGMGEYKGNNKSNNAKDISQNKDLTLRFINSRLNGNSIILANIFKDLGKYVRCSLNWGGFANPLLTMISQVNPNINLIDLSHNRIKTLSGFKNIANVLPHVKKINLSGNATLTSRRQFDYLKHLNLKELKVDPNHAKGDGKRYLLNLFPNLEYLNSEKLARKSLTLPTVKGNFISGEITKMVIPFIKQYFNILDSSQRDRLLGAYSENSLFSLGEKKLQGKSSIMKYFMTFPPTKHDLNGLVCDSFVYTCPNQTIFVTLHGLFKDSNGALYRFDRTMILTKPVQENWALSILNDLLSLKKINR